MSTADSLGDRMKGYERISQNELMRRTPVIIRIDGRAFHTFTRRFKKGDSPYNDQLHRCMMFTAEALTKQVQGCQLAYTQSDEISLLCSDWETLLTQSWFGYNVQKITSVSASIAASAFNFYLHHVLNHDQVNKLTDFATFDSRAHNLPTEEVTNYFIWRQQDAIRNSIQAFGQHYFSHNQLQGVSCDQIQHMLITQRDFNWNQVPTWQKRGSSVVNGVWDTDIPIFSQQRDYITSRLPQ